MMGKMPWPALISELVAAFILVFVTTSSGAADDSGYKIIIKDHRFLPAELSIPANQRVQIRVENQDATAEEFESYDLNREKVVSGNGRITLYIGPLRPGRYRYFGDFHPDTAQGVVVAQEK